MWLSDLLKVIQILDEKYQTTLIFLEIDKYGTIYLSNEVKYSIYDLIDVANGEMEWEEILK